MFNKESFWSVICPWEIFCDLRVLELTVNLVGILCEFWSLCVWPFLWDWYMLCVPYVGRILLVPKGRVSHHIRVVAYWCMWEDSPMIRVRVWLLPSGMSIIYMCNFKTSLVLFLSYGMSPTSDIWLIMWYVICKSY